MLFSLVTVAVVFALAYGAAASITVNNSNVGSGSGTVSGFSVSNVTWTLDSSDPTKIDKVEFDIDNTPNTVYAAAFAGSTNVSDWVLCTLNSTKDHATCDWSSNFDSANINSLQVAAAK
jgi:hypothetical protein